MTWGKHAASRGGWSGPRHPGGPRRWHPHHASRRDHTKRVRTTVRRIIRLDDRHPHAHLVVTPHGEVFVVRFDGRGRQIGLSHANSIADGRAIREWWNITLRRKS